MLSLPSLLTLFLTACIAQAASLGGTHFDKRAYPNPGLVKGDITGLHDPGIAKGPDGYVLIGTGQGLPIKTSKDRITWTNAGSVFPNGAPAETLPFTKGGNGDLWAPDVTYVNGKFILYFSASTFGSKNSGVFMAQSTTGRSGSWTYGGLIHSTTPSSTYNAIDPNLLIDSPTSWYLVLGSWSSGIQLLPLDPATGKVRSGSSPQLISGRNGGAEEAGFLFKEGGFYYLFTSWDKCCSGTSSTYNVRVSRASKVTGPYVDQAGVKAVDGGGTLILGSHGNIVGPGGQSILRDTNDIAIVYHWYTADAQNLGINLLNFSSGWPVVY